MIYPILLFTNLSSVLFVAFSLIYLPQVYVNALVGKRPDPNSVFYNEFLSYRFLTFVNPWLTLVLYEVFPFKYFWVKAQLYSRFGNCCVGWIAAWPALATEDLWAKESLSQVHAAGHLRL